MKVLFIGGTGVISSACSQLAVERGIELYLLSRGKSARPIPTVRTACAAISATGLLPSRRWEIIALMRWWNG